MDLYTIHQEFNWVNKVLFSSETDKHIECCVNLFKNFLNKWSFEMTEDLKISFNRDFNENYLFQREKVLPL
jgi:ribosome-associated toxin RatA of RatAB toxin-antitoxin module